MSTPIVITATKNSSQTAITVREESGISRAGFTDVVLYLTAEDYPLVTTEYALTEPQRTTFIADGEVEIEFLDIFGTVNIADDWWKINVHAASDEYLSNDFFFGVYADTRFSVYSIVNGVHIPEVNKGKMEYLYAPVMFVNGMGYLDTSSINDRGIKFKARQDAIDKMLSV